MSFSHPVRKSPRRENFCKYMENCVKCKKKFTIFNFFAFLRMLFQFVYDFCFKVAQDVAYACVSPM